MAIKETDIKLVKDGAEKYVHPDLVDACRLAGWQKPKGPKPKKQTKKEN